MYVTDMLRGKWWRIYTHSSASVGDFYVPSKAMAKLDRDIDSCKSRRNSTAHCEIPTRETCLQRSNDASLYIEGVIDIERVDK